MRENLYPTGVGNDEHEVEGWAEAERDLRKAVAEPATTTTAVPLVDAGESEAEIRADIVADAAADRMNELEDALVGALSLLGATVRADPDLVSLPTAEISAFVQRKLVDAKARMDGVSGESAKATRVRWDGNRNAWFPSPPRVEAFLDAYEALCQKHGLVFGHEDGHGSFEIHHLQIDPRISGARTASHFVDYEEDT
jgi:hypothetical protein